ARSPERGGRGFSSPRPWPFESPHLLSTEWAVSLQEHVWVHRYRARKWSTHTPSKRILRSPANTYWLSPVPGTAIRVDSRLLRSWTFVSTIPLAPAMQPVPGGTGRGDGAEAERGDRDGGAGRRVETGAQRHRFGEGQHRPGPFHRYRSQCPVRIHRGGPA